MTEQHELKDELIEKEENAPYDKNKVKVYLFLSLGLIILTLIIMTIWDIATRKPILEKEVTNIAESSQPKVQSGDDFSKLVNQRAVIENNNKQTNNINSKNIYQNEIAKEKQQQQETNSNNNVDFAIIEKKDPKKAAQMKWEIAELTRSWTATQSNWQSPSSSSPSKTHSNQINKTTISSKTSIDERRLAIAKQISEYDKIINTGSFQSYIPVANKATLNNTEQNKIQSLNKSFQSPPTDIVGYTKENSYNANIAGKYKLPVGTVIPAITAMKTMSDYAGTLKGFTTQDIYDIDYQHVLIPKGSEVLLKSVRIGNVNEPIQARMGLTVPWIILPNGKKIDFSKSSGLDREGVAGIKDKVDYHFLAQFFGVAAYATLSSSTSYQGSGANNDQSFMGNVSESARQQFAPLAQKYLSLVPTITIDAGQSMNIILEDELFLDAWSNIYSDYM